MVSWTAVAALAAVLVVKFTPEYSLHSSYSLTATAFVSTAWVASFIYTSILYPTYLSPLRHIPTPPNRSWLFGHTASLALRFPVEPIREWVKTVPNNGLIRYYVIGNRERVFLTSPKAISDLLVAKSYDFVRPEIARIQLETVTGEGLLLAEGDVHKAQRKSLMPPFSYRHIKDLYPVFWSKAVQMTNEIEKGVKQKNGEDTIQIRDWASRAMLDIIGLAGINNDFNSVKDPNNELARRYRSLAGETTVLQLLAVLHQQGEAEGAAVDILSVAMRSGGFTDSNLVDQMMTFLAAGHETTSSAFQWSIYALSKHSEAQTRLRKEIRETLPSIPFDDLDDIKDINDIKKRFSSLFSSIDSNNHHSLPFLWAFINEVLRFYPSVPFTSRQALRDTTLAGQYIPKGTNVLISPDVTNRDEDFWGKDAGTFKPERWLDYEDGAITHNNHGGAKSNYANLTFVHGPRSCIGQGFARAELAIFVAVFVYRFEFELRHPDKELEIKREITQTPADGVVVRKCECGLEHEQQSLSALVTVEHASGDQFSETMSAKRKTSHVEDHTNSLSQESSTGSKIRRVTKEAQSNIIVGQRSGGNDASAIATAPTVPQPTSKTQDQVFPRAPDFVSPSYPRGDHPNSLQNHEDIQPPQPPQRQPVQSSQATESERGVMITNASFSRFYRTHESCPLDYIFGYTMDVSVAFISTFRPSPLHLVLYRYWIARAIEMMSFPNMQKCRLFISLSSWCELDVSDPILPIPRRVAWPNKVDVPQARIGHLFSTSVFGNDYDIPLYYIQIVRGLSDAVKVVICASKRELVSSVYYELFRGYSTVLICGICQSVSRMLCSSDFGQDGIEPFIIYEGHTAGQAQELLGRVDKKIAIVC
ncbi:hypothetical protein UA08_08529 [Talaromyces atroroseus]|uniref:Cytochrome P450 n=1 Tax=Talaromyces atroroseus TaxID=1441469 RepID=A0A1Q5Q806_TALAT|nr:hypothetical protein UA08_08529 [Talaromyces atroroseus]OKL56355.1 hypothetical protein UA08_08529 [Talaromyces atroroseus]